MYIINQQVESAKRIYEHIKSSPAEELTDDGKKAWTKRFQWNGRSLYTAMFDFIEYVANVKIPKSNPNPYVHQTLAMPNVKARTHYGVENDFTQNKIESMMKNGTAVCYDIAKCHSFCLKYPLSKWIVIDYNDMWEPFDGHFDHLGLYWVETADWTLMHGDNIYSNHMLMKAHAENISFKVLKQLRAKESNSANLDTFSKIADAIDMVFPAEFEGNNEIKKFCMNVLSGMLGKELFKVSSVQINSNMEQVWNWLWKKGAKMEDVFVRELELNGTRYYLHGLQKKYSLSEHNVPMFIQLKDQANIMLYDMIKAMGGTLAFRKVDCAVCVGGKTIPESSEWGGWRKSPLPKQLGEPKRKQVAEFPNEPEWVVHHVNDSDKWVELMEVARNEGGLLIKGRAGTGKSYCAKMIA